jgi:hypothetical protein
VGWTGTPRPPELFDLVDTVQLPGTLVYPEPPVGDMEQEILDKALSQRGGGRNGRVIALFGWCLSLDHGPAHLASPGSGESLRSLHVSAVVRTTGEPDSE